MLTSCESQSLVALSAIAVNTGSMSVGEPLYHAQESQRRGCCSRASVSSRLRTSSAPDSRAVLDGDRRLIGEELEERDLLGRERLHACAADHDPAHGGAVAQQRHRQDRPYRQLCGRMSAISGKSLRTAALTSRM